MPIPPGVGSHQRLRRGSNPVHTAAAGVDEEQGRRVETQMARLAAVADLGQQALEGIDLVQLLDRAVALAVDSLGLDFCQVWELVPAGDALRLRAGSGWEPEMIGTLTVPVDPLSQPGYTMKAADRVLVQDVTLDLGRDWRPYQPSTVVTPPFIDSREIGRSSARRPGTAPRPTSAANA